MKLYNVLKQYEPLEVSTHNDADGIYSLALLASVFQLSKVEFPEFNSYTTKIALDLGSPNRELDRSYIVIDHHVHPDNPSYTLYWDTVPTGLIVYKHLKEYIPDNKKFYVVGSLVGDGQPELIPSEIWEMFPELLINRGVLYRKDYSLGTSSYPAYYGLSSGVNALCRLGVPYRALEIVCEADSPFDILEHPEVIDYQNRLKSEEESIYKSRFISETYYNTVLVRIQSSSPEYKLASLIATKLSVQDETKTYIVVNTANGEVSIRGVLSLYVVDKLKQKYKLGGHPGYVGGKIPLNMIKEFVSDVRRLKL